jgi:hypothetical protein
VRASFQVAGLFDEWVRACEASGTPEKAYPAYFQHLQQAGVLKNDESCERFFRILTVRPLTLIICEGARFLPFAYSIFSLLPLS